MIQHFMFQNPNTYSNLYLLYGDNADYLRPPFTAKWRQRFDNLDVLVGDMRSRAQSVGVPMMLMVGISAAQVSLIDEHPSRRAQAYAFAAEIKKIGEGRGIDVVNALPSFANRPDPMGLFYIADGHLAPRGQKIVAEALDKSLLASGTPPFLRLYEMKEAGSGPKVAEEAAGTTRWELDVKGPDIAPMKMVSYGFAAEGRKI